MASAVFETSCCLSPPTEPKILAQLNSSSSYNIVCMISSILGMVGAIFQLLPAPSTTVIQHRRSIGHTQKTIINWLAVADFFAAFGIFLRSAFWLKGEIQGTDIDLIVCAIFAFWIRFFYTATFMFTLCYAVDVYLVCKQKVGNHKYYHAFTWTVSLLLSVSGLGSLYLPDFKCHSDLWRILPNYILSYISIIMVMSINPVLYWLSSKNVRILLTGGLGQLTYLEHHLLSALKEKFLNIVLVFYVCWIPNIINGIILWGFGEKIPEVFLLVVWYFMAVVNPLQAVLNSLVYKGWENCGSVWKGLRFLCKCQSAPHSGLLIEPSSGIEHSPERHTYSTNNHVE